MSLRSFLPSVQAALETPLSAGLELEEEFFLACFGSENGHEGGRAFVE